jgi:hypothetical protein
MREDIFMKEIYKDELKKSILNYIGFRFSKQREPLSSFKVFVIVKKEMINRANESIIVHEWKEVI